MSFLESSSEVAPFEIASELPLIIALDLEVVLGGPILVEQIELYITVTTRN